MLTLAIDTSADLCAAALHDGDSDSVLAELSEDIGRGHAERLMDVIAGVLGRAGCDYGDLGRVAACAGPGSFTGVRVGLATARGIALGLGVPAVGVSSLEALALEGRGRMPDSAETPLLAVLDARRGQAYVQIFGRRPDGFLDGPFVASYETIAGMIGGTDDLALCGSGAPVLTELHGIAVPVIHMLGAAPVMRYALLASAVRIGVMAGARPEPIYLRPPDAKPQTGFAVARS